MSVGKFLFFCFCQPEGHRFTELEATIMTMGSTFCLIPVALTPWLASSMISPPSHCKAKVTWNLCCQVASFVLPISFLLGGFKFCVSASCFQTREAENAGKYDLAQWKPLREQEGKKITLLLWGLPNDLWEAVISFICCAKLDPRGSSWQTSRVSV